MKCFYFETVILFKYFTIAVIYAKHNGEREG